MNTAKSALSQHDQNASSHCEISMLPTGLRVASVTLPHVESVALNLFVDVGARYEALEVNGIAHLLEHMAFKGTARRSALDIAMEFDAIGGNLNAYTSMEHTVYYAKVLKDDVATALDILSDIMLHSTFDEEELERERLVILQEIAMHNDTPDDRVFDLFTERAWPDQALGRSILGPVEKVAAYTPDHIRAYVVEHYHAGRMILTFAGNITHAQALDYAEEYFGTLPEGSGKTADTTSYVGGDIREAKELEQLQLVLGFPGLSYRDGEYRAAQVLATVLGGGMSSRLFQEVREKRGLAYSIYAFNTAYSDCGLFNIYTGTGEREVAEVIPVVADTLLGLADTLEEEELERAKNQIKAGLVMAQESSGNVSEAIGRHLLAYGRYLAPADLMAQIDAVTSDDLRRVLGTFLTGTPTVAAIGPAGQLEAYDGLAKRFRV